MNFKQKRKQINIFIFSFLTVLMFFTIIETGFAKEENFANTTTKIMLTTAVTDISVEMSPDNKIHVIADGDTNKPFTIKSNNNQISIINVNEAFIDEIILQIPKNLKMVLDITSNTGNIDIENIKLKQLNVKNSASDIEIDNIEVDSIVLTTTAGNIDIEGSITKNATVKTSTGDINIKAKQLSVSSCETTSGNVYLSTTATVPNFKFNTTTGDINILIPISAKPKYSLKTSTGDVKSPKQNKKTKGAISVTTTTGNININNN